LGLRNYAIMIPVRTSCIKCNNKINVLQMYDVAQNYRIPQKLVQRLSQHSLKISSKALSKKIITIQTIHVGMSMISVQNFFCLI
jgi:hypothetical protein